MYRTLYSFIHDELLEVVGTPSSKTSNIYFPLMIDTYVVIVSFP